MESVASQPSSGCELEKKRHKYHSENISNQIKIYRKSNERAKRKMNIQTSSLIGDTI